MMPYRTPGELPAEEEEERESMWKRISWSRIGECLFGLLLVGGAVAAIVWFIRAEWKDQHDPCSSYIGRPVSQVPERCIHPKPPEPIYSAVPVPQ